MYFINIVLIEYYYFLQYLIYSVIIYHQSIGKLILCSVFVNTNFNNLLIYYYQIILNN